MNNYMVFDIGGSSVKWSVIEGEGKILQSGSIKIASNISDFFNGLAEITNNMKKEFDVKGIAISAPGAVDSETGVIGGVSAIPYIHGPNFKEELKWKLKMMQIVQHLENVGLELEKIIKIWHL